jgi:hypothetical protein
MPVKSPSLNRYQLNGSTHIIDPQAKLGAGSEGMVIAHPHDHSLCVKIFHPGEPGNRDAARISAYRSKKIIAITKMGLTLPPQFTLPMLPALHPTSGQALGYQMRRVPGGYFKLMKLLDGNFRVSHQVGLGMVARLFAEIFGDLSLLHAKGLVIGDVNLGCLMFQPGGNRAWVDTDSWSYPGFPCLATTELFAHPDLYPNLQSGNKFVPPQPHHDRFAFLVAFTMTAIPGAHPFRTGTHPQIRGLQNRTKAGLTIFDATVKFPAIQGSPEILSDELLQTIIERLKGVVNDPFDPDVLRAFAEEITTCKQCGTGYHISRRHCPKCREMTLVQAPALARFLIEKLLDTPGVLLFAQMLGKDLYLVCRTGDHTEVIRLDEQNRLTKLTPTMANIPGARYRFFPGCLVVCPEPSQPAPATLELYRIDANNLTRLQATSTGVLEGETAVFDTSSRYLYRTAANALVRSSLFGPNGTVFDEPVAEVHQNQSWFTADRTSGSDREVIFGYDRALRNWKWFIIHGNAKGGRYQYHEIGDLGIRAGETIEDFAVYFSASSVLLAMQTSLNGRNYARYAIIGLDGTAHLNQTVDSSDDTFAYWQHLRGKLYQGKSVLHITAGGVVKQQFSNNSCNPITGTIGQVSTDDQLIRLNGQVGVVRRGGVLAMTSK